MEKVSILEFRQKADTIIRKVQQGQRMILTYRGRPVLRLEPIRDARVDADDPFYGLARLATPQGKALTNEEIDQIVYDS
jgi:prevent-host-death family protein